MNAMNKIAEARASALSLRASAKACTGEQGALKFRLTRAAESLDTVVLLAMRGIERVEQIEHELRQHACKMHALSPAEDADIGDALRAVHQRLEHARACIADGMHTVDRHDHTILNIVLVMLDQHTGAELTDARIQRDSTREQASVAMGKQIARLRASLRVMQVSMIGSKAMAAALPADAPNAPVLVSGVDVAPLALAARLLHLVTDELDEPSASKLRASVQTARRIMQEVFADLRVTSVGGAS